MPDSDKRRKDWGTMLPLLMKRSSFEAILDSFKLPRGFLQTLKRNEPCRTSVANIDPKTGAVYHSTSAELDSGQ